MIITVMKMIMMKMIIQYLPFKHLTTTSNCRPARKEACPFKFFQKITANEILTLHKGILQHREENGGVSSFIVDK